jgi:hypothetical protein
LDLDCIKWFRVLEVFTKQGRITEYLRLVTSKEELNVLKKESEIKFDAPGSGDDECSM